MYEFTKDCMIGIKEIDDEHKKLFDMINDAIALADKTEDVHILPKILLKDLKIMRLFILPMKKHI